MSNDLLDVQHTVDASNQPCPMPILLLKRTLKKLDQKGQMILVVSTDPHSQQDLVHFCDVHSLKMHHQVIENNRFLYYIEN